MRKNDNLLTIFPCTVNNVNFDIFYNIESIPFRLVIVQLGSEYSFELEVRKGYEIDSFMPKEKYEKLCKILGLEYDPNNKFSPSKFFNDINSCIPKEFTVFPIEKRQSMYDYIVIDKKERSEGKYYYKKVEWSQKKRSKENSEKTWILFPEIYDMIKNTPGISICYTDDKSKKRDYRNDI